MAKVQVFNINNLAIAAAPPAYNMPNDNGTAMPNNHTAWQLAVDTGGTVPSGQPLTMTIQYQRGGVWRDDVGVTWETGTFTPHNGTPTTVRLVSSTIGNDNEQGAYPDRVRIHVEEAGAWTLPNVHITLD